MLYISTTKHNNMTNVMLKPKETIHKGVVEIHMIQNVLYITIMDKETRKITSTQISEQQAEKIARDLNLDIKNI